MRIGIDARLWNQTGVGRYIRNLVRELGNMDSQNKYILFGIEQDCENIKYQISNIKYKNNFQIVSVDISWHSIEEQVQFPNILNREKLDLVHFPYYSVPVFYNKPFVVTIHDLIPLHFQTSKASTLPLPFYKIKFLAFKFIVSQAAKKAKKIIAPSFATKEDIVKCLNAYPSKIKVVYEGTDEKLIKKVQPLDKKEHFLYIGNAYPHKNLETLVSAFSRMVSNANRMNSNKLDKNSRNSIKLVLVGREDYFYKRLKQKVKKMNLEDKIIFQGYATDEELSSLYKKVKALIIPSFMEGFGLPVLEAMANRCLVLASDIPVFHEVGGDAAIYFNPKDVSDLTEKIEYVCFNDLNHFSDYIDKGLERAKEFSWRKTAQETLRVYNDSLIDRM